MSRLIDADKLIERIEEITTTDMMKVLVEDWVNSQPTAFDVDKVVKQLERKSKIHNIVGESKNDIVNIYASACYDEAIEIVKAGGIDDCI